MGNQAKKLIELSAIPAVVGGAVPIANRYVIGQRNPDPTNITGAQFQPITTPPEERLIAEVLAKALTSGTHANLTLSIEGAFDGVTWYGLQYMIDAIALPGPPVPAGLIFPIASFQPGFVLRLRGGWPFYRIGLAGDGAGGTAEIGVRLIRP
jgi:hypothetical protein